MLWPSQDSNTNQGKVEPDCSVNLPLLHDKGAIGSAYTLLYKRLYFVVIQGCTTDSEFLG